MRKAIWITGPLRQKKRLMLWPPCTSIPPGSVLLWIQSELLGNRPSVAHLSITSILLDTKHETGNTNLWESFSNSTPVGIRSRETKEQGQCTDQLCLFQLGSQRTKHVIINQYWQLNSHLLGGSQATTKCSKNHYKIKEAATSVCISSKCWIIYDSKNKAQSFWGWRWFTW